jgi:hypothetical protein
MEEIQYPVGLLGINAHQDGAMVQLQWPWPDFLVEDILGV